MAKASVQHSPSLDLLVGLILLGGTAVTPAVAAEAHCMARIVLDAPAEEAPEEVLSAANKTFGPITIMKINKRTGKMLFCGAKSYCYTSNAFEINTPCRVKRDEKQTNSTYFSYFTR